MREIKLTILWAINAVIYGAILMMLLSYFGFGGYYAGYVVGAFTMMFYYVGFFSTRNS